MNNNRLLLVEDDAALGMLLMDYLESSYYHVSWKRDALSAQRLELLPPLLDQLVFVIHF